MIKFIKKLFSAKEKIDDNNIDENLACAILLVEISYSDFEIDQSEIESMTYLFEKNFKIPREKSEWLRDKALNLHKDTNCLRQYIRIINEKFSKVQAPIQLIWGEKDPWESLCEAKSWKENYKNIRRLDIIKGAGHCPHDENPEETNNLISSFIQETK